MDEQRWEYRIWPAPAHAAVEAIRREGQQVRREDRTDTYNLLDDPFIVPKLRDNDLLDVKQRIELRDEMERWDVLLKCGFPLAPEVLTLFPQALSDVPIASPEAFSHAARQNGLTVSSVCKNRVVFEIGTICAEITEIKGGGLPALTLCLEGLDHGAIRAAAERLGFLGLPNTSYGAALRAAL